MKPGVKRPGQTCSIPVGAWSHAVSANGTQLATGADDAAFAAQSGIYNVRAPTAPRRKSPARRRGLGGDARGVRATFTPDGEYRRRTQLWGGVNQLAWKIDDVAKTSPAASDHVGGPSEPTS